MLLEAKRTTRSESVAERVARRTAGLMPRRQAASDRTVQYLRGRRFIIYGPESISFRLDMIHTSRQTSLLAPQWERIPSLLLPPRGMPDLAPAYPQAPETFHSQLLTVAIRARAKAPSGESSGTAP